MTTAKELCLAIVKYFIDFGNKQFLPPVTQSPDKSDCLFKSFSFKYLNFSNHRKERKLHLQSKEKRVENPQRVRHLGNFG